MPPNFLRARHVAPTRAVLKQTSTNGDAPTSNGQTGCRKTRCGTLCSAGILPASDESKGVAGWKPALRPAPKEFFRSLQSATPRATKPSRPRLSGRQQRHPPTKCPGCASGVGTKLLSDGGSRKGQWGRVRGKGVQGAALPQENPPSARSSVSCAGNTQEQKGQKVID
jgi:hypothetical protein